jgi:hypothetical protein
MYEEDITYIRRLKDSDRYPAHILRAEEVYTYSHIIGLIMNHLEVRNMFAGARVFAMYDACRDSGVSQALLNIYRDLLFPVLGPPAAAAPPAPVVGN